MFPDCSLLQLGQTCLETTDLRLHQLQSHSAGNQWDKGEGRGRCGVRRKLVGSLINDSTSSESCIEFFFLLKNKKKKHFINPVKPRGLIGIFLLIDFFFHPRLLPDRQNLTCLSVNPSQNPNLHRSSLKERSNPRKNPSHDGRTRRRPNLPLNLRPRCLRLTLRAT